MKLRLRAAAAIAIATGALVASTTGGRAAPSTSRLPSPARATYERGEREALNASCERCHAGVAAEHRASIHARAFSDPSFQKGYAMEPAAFCRSCHAPESKPTSEPDAFARAHGVACVTCHVPEGATAVLASTRASARDDAPHRVARVDGFGTSACVACHDFAFPGSEALGEKGRMQKTALEHARSSARDRSCASCHMAARAGGGDTSRAHRFGESRNATLLASAVTIRAVRNPDRRDRAVFELRANGVGHALPTGDLFRRLVLRVETPRGRTEHAFERSFRATRDPDGTTRRFEVQDTRVMGERRLELALPSAAAELSWELVYQRVTGVSQSPPFAATIEDEIVVARGRL